MTARKQTTTTPAPTDTEAKPLKRADAVAALKEVGYAGPVSYSVPVLNDMLAWVRAGAPEGDGGIPAGAVHSMHPHLKPQPKAGNAEARALVKELRAALTNVLKTDDPADALDSIDSLNARLRAALA